MQIKKVMMTRLILDVDSLYGIYEIIENLFRSKRNEYKRKIMPANIYG
jgi:hypothetical protein